MSLEDCDGQYGRGEYGRGEYGRGEYCCGGSYCGEYCCGEYPVDKWMPGAQFRFAEDDAWVVIPNVGSLSLHHDEFVKWYCLRYREVRGEALDPRTAKSIGYSLESIMLWRTFAEPKPFDHPDDRPLVDLMCSLFQAAGDYWSGRVLPFTELVRSRLPLDAECASSSETLGYRLRSLGGVLHDHHIHAEITFEAEIGWPIWYCARGRGCENAMSDLAHRFSVKQLPAGPRKAVRRW